jgi:hypothetical protein
MSIREIGIGLLKRLLGGDRPDLKAGDEPRVDLVLTTLDPFPVNAHSRAPLRPSGGSDPAAAPRHPPDLSAAPGLPPVGSPPAGARPPGYPQAPGSGGPGVGVFPPFWPADTRPARDSMPGPVLPGSREAAPRPAAPRPAGARPAPAPRPAAARPAAARPAAARPAAARSSRSPRSGDSAPSAASGRRAQVAPGGAATCPYCALLLDPPPERGRLCPRCKRPIVVRRVNGLRVLLTREALAVFEAERDRETNERNWTGERRRWLSLARSVAAPERKVARLEGAAPSAASVESAKELYLASLEKAVRAARRARRWAELARIRRDQAAALYRAAGSPIPPPDDIVALHREWSTAALKAAQAVGRDAELVAGGCCAVCSKDDGRAFRIAAELKEPRLPHAGCRKGLCACDWYPLPDAKTPGRGKRKRTPRPASAASELREATGAADPTGAADGSVASPDGDSAADARSAHAAPAVSSFPSAPAPAAAASQLEPQSRVKRISK